MCFDCWERYETPKEVTADVLTAAILIGYLYEKHCVGGKLHIITDDWNIEESNFDWVRDNHYSNLDDSELCVFDFMVALTEQQRAEALAIYYGFITLDFKQ